MARHHHHGEESGSFRRPPDSRRAPLSGRRGGSKRSRHNYDNLPTADTHSHAQSDFERGPRTHDYPHRNPSHRSSRSRIKRRGRIKRKRINCQTYIFFAACIAVAYNYIIIQSNIISTDGKQKWSLRKKLIDKKAQYFMKHGKIPLNGAENEPEIPKPKAHALRKQSLSAMDNFSVETKYNQTADMQLRNTGRLPPISTLIDSKGSMMPSVNISSLLDFSIIGFPKTGTTSLLRHLSDLTVSLTTEHCELVVNDTAKLVRVIYYDDENRIKEGGSILSENRIRGIKCPQDVSSDWSMHNYAKYFPQTKLIVGIRHPVFW